jgi:hypothetical protein
MLKKIPQLNYDNLDGGFSGNYREIIREDAGEKH